MTLNRRAGGAADASPAAVVIHAHGTPPPGSLPGRGPETSDRSMEMPRPCEWHIISCEYPPQIGGVSSYVGAVAAGLAAAGGTVHVWCPPSAGQRPEPRGVTLHDDLGRFTPGALRRVSRGLEAFPPPRRLLIQWVPHGYGYRSLNVAFCAWARGRARRGDRVEVMVHEPFLQFAGSWRQWAAAAVHRMMTPLLLGAASRVWVSTPAWAPVLRRYVRARGVRWLPVPSPIEPISDPPGVAAVRSRYTPANGFLVGHFGAYSRLTAGPLQALVPRIAARVPRAAFLLMGTGSCRLREELLQDAPELAARIHASGVLDAADLSRHIQACDLLVQPYADGITSRRTSAMAPLAHGKPIVTTEGTASEAVWRDREAVCLVPLHDTTALVSAVERLLGDPAARSRTGCRARALYEDVFDVRHTVAALMAS